MFRNCPAIAVCGDLSLIGFSALWITQIIPVIPHREYQLVGDQTLVHQVQRQLVRHFLHHQPGLIIIVGTREDLTGAGAF